MLGLLEHHFSWIGTEDGLLFHSSGWKINILFMSSVCYFCKVDWMAVTILFCWKLSLTIQLSSQREHKGYILIPSPTIASETWSSYRKEGSLQIEVDINLVKSRPFQMENYPLSGLQCSLFSEAEFKTPLRRQWVLVAKGLWSTWLTHWIRRL